MPARIDLTGRTFGRWKVLRLDTEKARPGAYWLCRCECGTVKSVNGQALREGESTQCRSCSGRGQSRRPHAYKRGDRVGKWTILGGPRKADHHYPCRCECGTVQIVPVGNLLRRTSTQCGSCRNYARQANQENQSGN